MKENQTGIFCHLNGCGRDADPLASEMNDKDGFWNPPELECSMAVDNFTSGNENENEVRDFGAPCTIPSVLFEKDTDLYMDKNVMECELPELIVCYKESTHHVVKDICIDEGVPSEDKILLENCKDDHKGLCTSLPSNGNKHSVMNKESVDAEFLIPDGLKSSSGKDSVKDAANESGTKEKWLKFSSEDDSDQDDASECGSDGLKSSSESDDIDRDATNKCGPEDSMQTGEENCSANDKIMDDALGENLISNGVLSVQEFRTETSLKSLLESSNCGGSDIEQESGQISRVESFSKTPSVISTSEESTKSGLADDLIYNSKVESGTITFNFDSSTLAASTREQNPENVHEQPLRSQNVPILKDGVSDNLSVTNQVQHGEGESSFSAAGHVSGLITYSGPIAYSGSVSLRSDSSTTSTRSFAFPVLQSEWNSSPVRMAKADRRRFRKHSGWRQGLLCCRF